MSNDYTKHIEKVRTPKQMGEFYEAHGARTDAEKRQVLLSALNAKMHEGRGIKGDITALETIVLTENKRRYETTRQAKRAGL